MIPLTATSRGDFAKQIQQRMNQWSEAGPVIVKLKASDEMAREPWWYWHEWGTAKNAERGGGKGRRYPIKPKTGGMIAFPGREGAVIRPHIGPPHTRLHPGIKPSRYIRLVMDEIHDVFHAAVNAKSMTDPNTLKQSLIDAMEKAKTIIVKSLDAKVKGRREAPSERGKTFPKQAGKLGGRTAADVFKSDTTVVSE